MRARARVRLCAIACASQVGIMPVMMLVGGISTRFFKVCEREEETQTEQE